MAWTAFARAVIAVPAGHRGFDLLPAELCANERVPLPGVARCIASLSSCAIAGGKHDEPPERAQCVPVHFGCCSTASEMVLSSLHSLDNQGPLRDVVCLELLDCFCRAT
jgi:hypothetical protein